VPSWFTSRSPPGAPTASCAAQNAAQRSSTERDIQDQRRVHVGRRCRRPAVTLFSSGTACYREPRVHEVFAKLGINSAPSWRRSRAVLLNEQQIVPMTRTSL
jgi:hypothetical protein